MSEGLGAGRALVSLRRWTVFPEVAEVLERCLADLGGMERYVQPGQTVVIKPNLTATLPVDLGCTTHVELVEALVRLVQHRRPGRVVVAEGTGTFGLSLDTAFPTGGWREMAARTGAELCNLDGGPHVDRQPANPRYPYPIPLARPVLDADVFIAVPCLKTHIEADYTVALKNSFGLTPQWKRTEIHRQELLEQALVDINRIHRPDLIVVDAWHGMEGIAGGTLWGRPAGARLMIAGEDPVAVDVVSRAVMGITARTRYLDWAIEEGLGEGDLDRIRLVGDPLAACRHPFLTPGEHVVERMPMVTLCDQRACSGCRTAALMCVHRFAQQRQFRPVAVVFGQEGDVPETEAPVLALGDCAARYAHLGTHVPGCPPRRDDIVAALRGMGRVCEECVALIEGGALRGLPEELLACLRVTAAGSSLHTGRRVERDKWHLELIVGDCMRHYAQMVRGRAASLGMDAERDVAWLEACPPSAEAIRQALGNFLERCRETGAHSQGFAQVAGLSS